MVMAGILLQVYPVFARDPVSVSQDGLVFELTTNQSVYASDDFLSVRYSVRNVSYPGAMLEFSSSQRVDIAVETPAGRTGSNVLRYSTVAGRESIPRGMTFTSGVGVNLAALTAAGADTQYAEAVSVSEGVTLRITAQSAADGYGIEEELPGKPVDRAVGVLFPRSLFGNFG